MSNVLGSAYIEIKPTMKGGIDASVVRNIESKLGAAGVAGGAAMEKAIAAAGKRTGASLGQSLSSPAAVSGLKAQNDQLIKIAQHAAAAADAQTKFSAKQISAQNAAFASQERYNTAVEKYGKSSLQARSAQQEFTAATFAVTRSLGSEGAALAAAEAKAGRMGSGMKRAGTLGQGAFSTIAMSSNGAMGPIGELMMKMQGMGGLFQSAGTRSGKALLGIGAAAMATGGILTAAGDKDTTAQNQLKAAIAGTGKSWGTYSKGVEEAIKTGEKYGYTANQSMDALKKLTMATHDPDKALKGFGLTLNMAAARHVELSSAAQKLGLGLMGNTRGLKQYGIVIESNTKYASQAAAATKAHDAAVTALGKAQQKLTDITSVNASKSKLSVSAQISLRKAQDAVTIAIAKSGVGSLQAISASQRLSDMQLKLSSSSKLSVSSQIALRNAHDAVTKAQDKVKQSSLTMTSAQKKAKDGADNFNQVLAKGGKILAGQAAAGTETFTGKMKKLKAQVEDTAAGMGQKFGGMLMASGPALMGVGAIIETGVIGKTGKAIKNLATFSKESRIVQMATKAWAAATWLLDAAMNANPIGIAVVAIAALVAGVILAYNHFKPFHDMVDSIGRLLKGAFTDSIAWVSHSLGVLWSDMQTIWGKIWKFLQTWGPLALAAIMPMIGIPLLIFQHWGAITKFLSSLWSSIQTIFGVGVKWVENLVAGFLTREVNGFHKMWTDVSGVFSGLWKDVKGIWNGAINWISGIVLGFIALEIRGFTNLWNNISSIFSKLWTGAKTLFSTGLAGIVGLIAGWARGALGMLSGAGSDIVRGLINGVTGMARKALDAVKSVGSSIIDGVKSFFGIHSPSSVFADLGGNLIKGLIQGIIKNKGQVGHLVKSVFGDVAGGAAGALGWLQKQGGSALSSVLGGAKSALGKVFGGLFGSSGGGAAGTGSVGAWIAQALAADNLPMSWAGPANTMVMRESGGNPKAINLWDSNAMAGHPSKGIAQMIDSTFQAHRNPALPNDIYNPIANLASSFRYILAQYGSIFNVQQAVGKTPKGYSSGGTVPGEGFGDKIHALLEPGEFVIPKSIVNMLGVSFFENLRTKRFATGGLVGATLRAAASSRASATAKRASAANKRATAAHVTAVRMANAHRLAAAHAAAAVAAQRLAMSMGAVTYGESLFSKAFSAGQKLMATAPSQYEAVHAALIRQATALVTSANANERATRNTTKHTAALKAQAQAVAELTQARGMISPNAESISAISQASKQSAMSGTGLSDLFNYQPGYGASSVSSVIANLKQKLALSKTFSGYLGALGSRGLGVDMIQNLIAIGPQAGIGIAQQILSDPSAILTIQSLTSQISASSLYTGTQVGQMTTAVGLAMGGSALSHFGSGGLIRGGSGIGDNKIVSATPGEYVIQKRIVDAFGVPFFDSLNGRSGSGSRAAGPTGRGEGSQSGGRFGYGGGQSPLSTIVHEAPLMQIQGDLIIRNESDLVRIQAALYQKNAAQKRATGMGR